MAPYDEAFIRLQTGDETRKIARSLYTKAAHLTTHGSGRRLGLGRGALFAICAFLASQKLGNGEVTKAQACAAACIDPKIFDTTLSNVEDVLRTAPSPQHNQRSITFWSLSKTYVAREDAYVPMVDVEEALKACGILVDGAQIDLGSPVMQCAIFYWVCTAILQVTIPDAAHFREILKVSPKKWAISQRVLENNCSHMVDDLIRKAKTALSARTSRSETRAAIREGMQATLTNLMTRPDGPSILLTPPKTPLIRNMKRKSSFEIESRENGSPSKRAKPLSYVPSKLGQDVSTHTPIARRTNAASLSTTSQPAASQEDDSETDEVPKETIVVRSTRPSQRQVDHSAWNSQRPKLATIGREPVTPTSTQDSPSVGAEFDITPMTSTGMSEISSPSPSSPSLSHAESRVRRRMAPAVKKLSYSIQEDEEICRRRRRNLRATFLDPSVYGWKPSAHTLQKLERARMWESHMIQQCGDPWDA